MGGDWLVYMEICCCILGAMLGLFISRSTDSRLLLSDSKDSTLKVWDIQTQKLKLDLPGHADEVYDVDWSPEDGEKVASGGKYKGIEIMDGLD